MVPDSDVEMIADPNRFTFTMNGVATPDSKQSEAYISTCALFHVFSGNSREEKAALRLPPAWRDLFSELAEAKKKRVDSEDRIIVKDLRSLVRLRRDQELEDGVIIQGAFRGRGGARNPRDSPDSGSQDRSKPVNPGSDLYKKIWSEKSSSHKYQAMLVSFFTECGPTKFSDSKASNLVLNSLCGASRTRSSEP